MTPYERLIYALRQIIRRQIGAITFAALAFWLAYKIPPYDMDDGGLFSATVYFPFRNPPHPAPNGAQIVFDDWFFKIELAFICLSLSAALLALRTKAKRSARLCLRNGLLLAIALMAWLLPQCGMVLAVEIMWYGLCLLAFILLVIVIALGSEPDATKIKRPKRSNWRISLPR